MLKPYFKYLRFVVCFLLLYLAMGRVDFTSLKSHFSSIHVGYLLLIMSVFFTEDMIKAIKWHTLLIVQNIKISILRILQVDFASRFLGLFVPFAISQDFFRAYGLSKEIAPKKETISSIIFDRFISFFALVLFASICVTIFHGSIRNPNLGYIVYLVLLLLLVLILLGLNPHFNSFIVKRELWLNTHWLMKIMNDFWSLLYRYRKNFKKTAGVFILAIFINFGRILVYYLSSLALNTEIEFKYFLLFIPIVVFFVMIPISWAGVGIREGSFVFLFTQIGVPPSTGFAISALVSIMVIIWSLTGGVIFLTSGLSLTARNAPIYKK